MGLKCPQPVLELALRSRDMRPGEILEVHGDCPTLERDLRTWCERLGKALLSVEENSLYHKIIQIQF
jgi:tRNA 2-thiouridine synthesizing protein A